MGSTNTAPPRFGPRHAIYPQITQFLRVTGTADSNGVYPALLQQAPGAVASLRDREASYIWEPNGISLPLAKLKARLVGSYTGLLGTLPLFATSLICCVGRGPFSSPSVPSLPSGAPSESSEVSSPSSSESSLPSFSSASESSEFSLPSFPGGSSESGSSEFSLPSFPGESESSSESGEVSFPFSSSSLSLESSSLSLESLSSSSSSESLLSLSSSSVSAESPSSLPSLGSLSSSSSSSQGGVIVKCCTDGGTAPNVVHVAITGGTGLGACLNGTYTLTFDGISTWKSAAPFDCCPGGTGFGTKLSFQCFGGTVWQIQGIGNCGFLSTGFLVSQQCLPTFQVVFAGVPTQGACAGGTITITITA